MCLCVLLYQELASHPVIAAANREERYDRPALPPAWISRSPAIFAGQDQRAWGTWQGVNEFGLLVVLTNRRSGDLDPNRRSRGLLCLDALRCRDARMAAEWLQAHLATQSYNPCNLLCADATAAFAVHHDNATTRVVPLSPGVHFLADTEIDDAGHPRLRSARAFLQGKTGQPWPTLRQTLARLLADHGDGQTAAGGICLHGERSGTVSSAIIALTGAGLKGAEFFFAEGPPCLHPYQDLSASLHSPLTGEKVRGCPWPGDRHLEAGPRH